MRLKHVYIFPHITAKESEEIINDAIEQVNPYEEAVDYELMIETSMGVPAVGWDTRYTLVINEYYLEEDDEEGVEDAEN